MSGVSVGPRSLASLSLSKDTSSWHKSLVSTLGYSTPMWSASRIRRLLPGRLRWTVVKPTLLLHGLLVQTKACHIMACVGASAATSEKEPRYRCGVAVLQLKASSCIGRSELAHGQTLWLPFFSVWVSPSSCV